MTDRNKSGITLFLSVLLIMAILASNIFPEHALSLDDLRGHLQRRMYFEKSISGKGLDLHKGMYWKEKE